MSGSWGELLIGTKQGTTTVGGAATGSAFTCPGGLCVFSVVGTFGGATVALYVRGPDGTTWLNAGVNTTLTAAGMGTVYLPPCEVQAQISGGAPSGIFAALARVVG
jgi:hypothetical protein